MAKGLTDSQHYTDIATAIRAKKGTSETLTPGQMATEISGMVTAAEMTNAEEYTFGTGGATEYAVTDIRYTDTSNNTDRYVVGWKFEVLSPLSVKGFRMMNSNNSYSYTTYNAKLYRVSDSYLVASSDVACEKGATADVLLSTAVDLTVGETYAVFIKAQRWLNTRADYVNVNGKIRYVTGIATYYSTSLSDILASDSSGDIRGVIFPIFGDPIDTSIPAEYKVQLTTMNEIALQVQRITGETEKMSTSQMSTALQELDTEPTLQDKTVAPSDTQQTITADDGFDGLGTVTVESIKLQDKTVIPSSEQQTITADQGYDGLGTVTVGAVEVLQDAREVKF